MLVCICVVFLRIIIEITRVMKFVERDIEKIERTENSINLLEIDKKKFKFLNQQQNFYSSIHIQT